jgi:uncharacterized protein
MSIDKSTGVPADDASVSQYLFKKGSGWTEWRNWQQSGFFWRYSDLIESNRMPKVLGMFLLGFYAGRKMIYADPENYVPMFKKIRRWGFLIGIPCSIAMVYFYIDDKNVPKAIGLLDTLFYAFSVVPLSLAYVSTFCLYWIKKKGNSKLKILAPVGKMALTNYIMQTTMGIIIFYGVGFGFGGRVGPSIFYPVAIGMYLLQVLYSNTWFRYFNYGPLEWIWRQLTYGKRLPLRKVNKI